MGRQLQIEFYSAPSQDDDKEVGVDRHDLERVREMVTEVALVRQELLDEVKSKMETSRAKKRNPTTILAYRNAEQVTRPR